MERLGFYVCVADLEEELIRSLGTAAVEQVVDAQGELGSFRTFQKQPAQQGRSHRGRSYVASWAPARGARSVTRRCSSTRSISARYPVRWTGSSLTLWSDGPTQLTVPSGPAGAGMSNLPGTFLPGTPLTVSVE